MNVIYDWKDIKVGDTILYGHIGDPLIIGYARWTNDYMDKMVNDISVQELVNEYTVIKVV